MAKSKRLWVLIVIAALSVILSVCSITLFAYAADNNEWSVDEIKESYAYGESFEIPTATYHINNKDYTATHSIIKPDGTCVSHDTISLDAVGQYELNYYVTASGRTYSKSVSFKVDYPSYYVGKSKEGYLGGKTTVSWGIDKYALSTDTEKAGHDTEAMIIKLYKGETFVLNEFIDITELTKSDILINGYISPERRGNSDFYEFMFTFTDSVDPSISLRVRFTSYEDYGTSFVACAGNGQELSGQNYYGNMQFHQGDDYGTSSGLSFGANRYSYATYSKMPQEADHSEAMFNIRYDSDDVSVYHGNAKIAKLNDSDHFAKNPWNGFSSNKVKLSITATRYISDVATIAISDLFGFTKEQLEGLCVKGATVVDSEGPVITVDQDTGYNAVCGGSYPIPAASAFDVYDGNTDVSVKVWYLYNSEDKVRINVKDGRFETTKVGQYVIEYISSDIFGNTTTKTINVLSVPKSEVDAISYNVDFTLTSCKVGERTILPEPTSISGGIGEKSYKIYATSSGGVTELKNNEFFPETIENWTVKYVVTDYLGITGEKTYTVNVTENDKPVIIQSASISAYYVSGKQYVVPYAVARDYNTAQNIDCKVAITDDDGKKEYLSGQTFTPVCAGDDGVITFDFYANEQKVETKTASIIKVMVMKHVQIGNLEFDDEVMAIDRFFIGEKLNFSVESNALLTTATDSGSNWTFITPQSSNSLSVSLKNFDINVDDSVTIKLTDYADSKLTASITLARASSNTTVFVNGVRQSQPIALRMEGVNQFTIGYSEGAFTVNGDATYNLGSSFEGFSSGRVYISCSNSMDLGKSYIISSINGYEFTAATADKVGPNIVVSGLSGGVYSKDSSYTFEPAICYDVLFENIKNFTLTVKSPDNKSVTDINGVVLNGVNPNDAYMIKLTEYGSYKVSYIAEDACGNVTEFAYTIVVFDSSAPEIKFKADTAKTAKVGEAIYMPDYEISDNISSAENITVLKYVFNPNGKKIWLTDLQDGIVTTMAGIYEFHIMAIDEQGNIAEAKYSVKVG